MQTRSFQSLDTWTQPLGKLGWHSKRGVVSCLPLWSMLHLLLSLILLNINIGFLPPWTDLRGVGYSGNIWVLGTLFHIHRFNKDMYAKMRAKKDEPLSNIGRKRRCVSPEMVLLLFQSPLLPPSSLVWKRRGQLHLRPRLKNFQLLSPKDHVCLRGRRKRLTPVRPLFGVTRGWQWTGLMGLW